MNKIVRMCSLMLINSVVLSSTNAMSLQDMMHEEEKTISVISGLCNKGELQQEMLDSAIDKVDASYKAIKKGMSSISYQDDMSAYQLLGRLRMDLLFLKAIRAYKKNPDAGREALMSFGRSNYRYRVLTKEICGDIGEF